MLNQLPPLAPKKPNGPLNMTLIGRISIEGQRQRGNLSQLAMSRTAIAPGTL
jgi:hypothetical protein